MRDCGGRICFFRTEVRVEEGYGLRCIRGKSWEEGGEGDGVDGVDGIVCFEVGGEGGLRCGGFRYMYVCIGLDWIKLD